jgi:hypothetical protein
MTGILTELDLVGARTHALDRLAVYTCPLKLDFIRVVDHLQRAGHRRRRNDHVRRARVGDRAFQEPFTASEDRAQERNQARSQDYQSGP